MLTFGSLFSGAGGLDLAVEAVTGATPAWFCEVDKHASTVLEHRFPGVPNLGDVTAIDWADVARVDILCGGYPCQPFSTAGLRRGTDDPRHLWPHMLRAVRVLRPRYVFAENVAAHLGLGFDQVLSDLTAIGFDAEWSVVSACSVGAPHLRRRLFFVAYPCGEGPGPFSRGAYGDEGEDEGRAPLHDLVPVGHAAAQGRATVWRAEPDVAFLADGLPGGLVRGANRAYGNAVVPQVAELIGRQIVSTDRLGVN